MDQKQLLHFMLIDGLLKYTTHNRLFETVKLSEFGCHIHFNTEVIITLKQIHSGVS